MSLPRGARDVFTRFPQPAGDGFHATRILRSPTLRTPVRCHPAVPVSSRPAPPKSRIFTGACGGSLLRQGVESLDRPGQAQPTILWHPDPRPAAPDPCGTQTGFLCKIPTWTPGGTPRSFSPWLRPETNIPTSSQQSKVRPPPPGPASPGNLRWAKSGDKKHFDVPAPLPPGVHAS